MFAFEMCDILNVLNAVLHFARDVRHFAFCVQFLDLCVKFWKNYETNLFLVYVMLWELCEPVIFQIWMEGHISRQRVCKINAALLNVFSNDSKMSVCWCRAPESVRHWLTDGLLRARAEQAQTCQWEIFLWNKLTNKHENNYCAFLWLRFCTFAWFGFMTPQNSSTSTVFFPLLTFIYWSRTFGWDIFPF